MEGDKWIMEYTEQKKKEISERWFENHQIKSRFGANGVERIVWGTEGTNFYQIEYTLSGNMVFISGDLGDAAFSLTCRATLENIKDFNLHYFLTKLTAHSRDRWDFDDELAKEEIKEHFLERFNLKSISKLKDVDSELYEELIAAAEEHTYSAHFETCVWRIYNDTHSLWFDTEVAEVIAEYGRKLSPEFIAYWLGLQMIIEQLEQKKE